jgi:ABC-type antimicrobial peptide transport system permease subunit
LSVLATLLALPLIQVGFYFFKHLLPVGLELSFASLDIWLFLLGISVFTGLLSGAYPALIMSKFKPVQALKSKIYSAKGKNISSIMRKMFTVFQFGFAQLLVAFTLAGILQMNKLAKTELGFQKTGLMHMDMPWSSPQRQKDIFLQKLRVMPDFGLITTYSNYPSRPGYNTTIMSYKKDTIEISTSVHSLETDTSYLNFFGLKLEEGRLFEAVDSLNEIVVNRSFMNYYGFNSLEDIENVGFKNSHIVGVLQDYHFQSLHHKIEPLALQYWQNNSGVGIRLSSQNKNKAEITAKIESLWNDIFGNTEFSPLYITDSVNKQYKKEENLAKLVYATTGAAIFISCLGLFGLVSFTVTQRTKEIGVRKVLGASTTQIVKLISLDFIKLVFIAFIISFPISYYYIDSWLEGFTVRINHSVSIYLSTLLITLLLAIVTLIYQTIQTAFANPVVSLRDE